MGKVFLKIAIIGTVASSIFGFRQPLIREILAKRHEVYAFAMDYTEAQKNELLSWGVTPVDYTLSRSGLNPFSDITTMLELKHKIQKIQPDVVLSYFVKPVIYGSLAAWLGNVPKRIAMLEGLGYAFTNPEGGPSTKVKLLRKVQILLYKISFPFIDKLVLLNPDDKDDLLVKYKLKPKETVILGGIGLDLSDFPYKKPETQKDINFLFIGRLLAEKGIHIFSEAASLVKKRYPNAIFTVLGSIDESNPGGMSQKELNKFIEMGVLTYFGQVTDVNSYINDSSVFVLPSYYREGVPRSSQEAMAVGRPILTTDVPGCRETVVEGVNGFLVPAFDVEKLSERMIWFIENLDQIEPMGLASRKMAEEKFDVHKVNARMLEIMGL